MNEPLPPGDEPPDGGDPESFYAKHFPRLADIAAKECGIGRAAAEELANAVLVSFIPKTGRVTDPAMWLDAAMRAACKLIGKPEEQR